MRDEAGVSKGFGFVCFAFPDDGTKAATAMHLKIFMGKPLYVGLAEKRDHRSARLQQRFRMATVRPNGAAALMFPNQLQQHPSAAAAASHHQPQMFYSGQQQHLAGMYGAGGPPGRPMPGTGFGGMPPGAWKHGGPRPYNLGPTVAPAMGGGATSGTPSYPYHIGVNPMNVPQPGGVGASAANVGGAPMRGARPPRSGMGGYPGVNNGGGGGPQPNFKFTPQARNRDYPQLPGQSMVGMGGAPPGIPQPGTASLLLQQQGMNAAGGTAQGAAGLNSGQTEVVLSAQTLAAAHPQMQKQMLGERLFPLVAKLQPELAGKITGMMLEMDNGELLSLLDSESQLQAKVDEAVGVLHRHKAIAPPTAQPPPSSSAFVRLGA